MTSPAHVVVLAYDGVQSLDVAGPVEVFVGADQVIARRDGHGLGATYRVSTVGRPPTVRSESGLVLGVDDLAAVLRGRTPIDTLVVPGGTGVLEATGDAELVDALERLARRARRTATVCSGAFLAGEAGLLTDRTVTTHWARAAQLARRHPDAVVDPEPIHLRDGELWSSAGVTAGIDLALAMVEDDHDAEVAQIVARWLVMFLRRPGGQSQFSTALWSDRADPGPIRAAQELVEATPGDDHRIGALARRVGMSERHFVRRFSAEVGISPARYVAGVRVDRARTLLETTDDTVAAIARRCGFGTAETMRRAFVRRLGVPPDDYRHRFRAAPTT